MKIKITSDSTCDLSSALLSENDISTMPLHILLGDEDYFDGVTVHPKDLFDYYKTNNKLPKSASRSVDDYVEFFQSFISAGYDCVIHYSLSSGMSSSYNNAVLASQQVKNVFVVDSKNLSTGTGLLVMDACDMVKKGATAQQIVERSNKRADFVQASFIIDTLEFLHKGGRCSSLAYLGANLLQIKPIIEVKNGQMGVARKPIGRYTRCLDKYIADIKSGYFNPDKKRCFVTHTLMDEQLVQHVMDEVKSWNVFDEVIETDAGSTITTHCGQNTIGILFINDGDAQ